MAPPTRARNVPPGPRGARYRRCDAIFSPCRPSSCVDRLVTAYACGGHPWRFWRGCQWPCQPEISCSSARAQRTAPAPRGFSMPSASRDNPKLDGAPKPKDCSAHRRGLVADIIRFTPHAPDHDPTVFGATDDRWKHCARGIVAPEASLQASRSRRRRYQMTTYTRTRDRREASSARRAAATASCKRGRARPYQHRGQLAQSQLDLLYRITLAWGRGPHT